MQEFNIAIQATTNDTIKKFVANTFLVQAESFEFKNIDEAKDSPLAQQLFHLPFVKTIYISQNFIAIEKFNIVEWDDVEDAVAEAISGYLNDGLEVIQSKNKSTKVPVTVYAESTPNPNVMKFVSNKPLVDGIFEFKIPSEASSAPIAQALFQFPFVDTVFIAGNYISITKKTEVSWQEIVMEIRDFIKEYLESGQKIILDDLLKESLQESTTDKKPAKTPENDIEKEIVNILKEYVEPAVAGDGGHIAFESYEADSKTVRVLLQGACSGCPSSTVTLKNGIETMLREMLQGKVNYVEAING
mgnify:CR=1 FL=1